jgi:SAM-dependent methyltransferase
VSGRARSFGAEADRYERARPTYAVDAVRFVLPAVPCRVADVGAGTGKLTEVLLRLGCGVVAIEPDDAMRARIRGAETVAATAEELPLADGSLDAVVAGQAFHWFVPERFLAEAARVLQPGGTLGLLWNLFDDRVQWLAWFAERSEAVDRFSRMPVDEPPFAHPAFAPAESAAHRHVQRATPELLVDRVASSSRAIALAPPEREALLAEVRGIGEAQGAAFDVPYITNAWRAVRRDRAV